MAQGEASVLQAAITLKENELSPALKEIAKELKSTAQSFESFNRQMILGFKNVENSLKNISPFKALDQDATQTIENLKNKISELERKVVDVGGGKKMEIVDVDKLRETVEMLDKVSNSQQKVLSSLQTEFELEKKISDERKNRKTEKKEPDMTSKILTDYNETLRVIRALNVEKNETLLIGDKELKQQQQILQIQSQQRIQTAAQTPQGALDFARQADTTNKMAEAMKALKISIGDVPVDTPKYKELNIEIQRLSKNMMTATTAGVQQSRMANQLARSFENLIYRVAFYGSLGMLTRFIKGIAETRGEYEKLEKSFGGIIGNLQEAQTVLERQKELAVFSPFAVKQLQEANKQLAAFGYNAKEIIPLTMQIGDIAAGIGMEMSKLISILGRVKGTGILNTRDLKSLASEGLNVADMLAKMYSEVENRDVKIREVYQRAASSMITYADLLKVINKYTEEGGMFFEAQAKQADTLKGTLKSLGDAITNMMQEIGKSNESWIKDGINAVRIFVENWKSIGEVIKYLLLVFGTYKGTILAINTLHHIQGLSLIRLGDIWKVFTLSMQRQNMATTASINVLTASAKGLDKVLMTLAKNPYAIIATVIITAAYTAYKLLKEEIVSSDELIQRTTKNIEELKQAEKKLGEIQQAKKNYQDFLKTISDTKEKIDELNESTSDRMRSADEMARLESLTNKAEEAHKELNKTAKILGVISEDTSDNYEEIANKIGEAANKAEEAANAELARQQKILGANIRLTEKAIKNQKDIIAGYEGAINSGWRSIFGELSVRMTDTKISEYGKAIEDANKEIERLQKTLEDLQQQAGIIPVEVESPNVQELNQLQDKIQKVLDKKGVTFATMFPGKTMDDLQTVLDYTSALTGRQDEYNKKREQLNETIKNGSDEAKAAAEIELDNLDKAESAYKEIAKILAIVADLKSGKNQVLEDFKNIVSTIKEAQKDYKEFLNISSNVERSVSAVSEKFADIWKKLKLPEMDLAKVMKMGNIELAAYLQTFLNDKRVRNNKEAQEYLKKFIGDLTFNAKIDFEKRAIDAFKEELDRIMRGYQVHLEFEKIDDTEVREFVRQLSEDLGVTVGVEFDYDTAISKLENLIKNLEVQPTFEEFKAQQLEIGVDEKDIESAWNNLVEFWKKSEQERVKISAEAEQEIANIKNGRLAEYQKIMQEYIAATRTKDDEIAELERQNEEHRKEIERSRSQEEIANLNRIIELNKLKQSKLREEIYKTTQEYNRLFNTKIQNKSAKHLEELWKWQNKIVNSAKKITEGTKKGRFNVTNLFGLDDTEETDISLEMLNNHLQNSMQILEEIGHKNPFKALKLGIEELKNEKSILTPQQKEELEDLMKDIRLNIVTDITGGINTLGQAFSGLNSNIGKMVDDLTSVVGNIAKASSNTATWGDKFNSILAIVMTVGQYLYKLIFEYGTERAKKQAEQLQGHIDRQAAMLAQNEREIDNYYRRLSITRDRYHQEEMEKIREENNARGEGTRTGGTTETSTHRGKTDIWNQNKAISEQNDLYKIQYKMIEAQIESLQRQNELYEDASTGKQDYNSEMAANQKEIDDLQEKLDYFYADLTDKFLGTGLEDAARNFGQIFADSVMQGIDYMDDFRSAFAQMIQNLIVESFLLPKMVDALDPFFTRLDKMVEEKGGVLSEQDVFELMGLADESLDAMSNYAEVIRPLLERLKQWSGDAIGEWDTLQKGIPGVTEQTAGVLESYMNQVRSDVAALLANSNYSMVKFDTMLDVNSDILFEMRASVQIQRSIENILLSVVGVGGVTAGQAMKVTVVNF